MGMMQEGLQTGPSSTSFRVGHCTPPIRSHRPLGSRQAQKLEHLSNLRQDYSAGSSPLFVGACTVLPNNDLLVHMFGGFQLTSRQYKTVSLF